MLRSLSTCSVSATSSATPVSHREPPSTPEDFLGMHVINSNQRKYTPIITTTIIIEEILKHT